MTDAVPTPVRTAAKDVDARVATENGEVYIVSDDSTGESDGAVDLLETAQNAGFETSPAFDFDHNGTMAWKVAAGESQEARDTSTETEINKEIAQEREGYFDNRNRY